MKRSVFNHDGSELIREDDAEPVCGEDFCDRCGDCLHCYGYDQTCPIGSDWTSHWWVLYEDKPNQPRRDDEGER